MNLYRKRNNFCELCEARKYSSCIFRESRGVRRIKEKKWYCKTWSQLNKVKAKTINSKLLEVVLEEKRRETIKEWIDSGKITDIQ
jgi:hypothetical protein